MVSNANAGLHSPPPNNETKTAGSNNKGNSGELADMKSSISSPPPGFNLLDPARFHGENISRAAAASAPPTSLFSNSFDLTVDSSDKYARLSGHTSSENESSSARKLRTMSYNNLAAALGEGLAECMGESLLDSIHKKRYDLMSHNSRISSSSNVGDEIDNIARQNRHSTRLRRGSSAQNLYFDDHDMFLHVKSRDDNQEEAQNNEPSVQDEFSIHRPEVATHSRMNIPLNYHDHANVVTVVEPSPSTTPALGTMNGGKLPLRRVDDSVPTVQSTTLANTDAILAESTQNLLKLDSNNLFKAGRASAPPQLFISQTRNYSNHDVAGPDSTTNNTQTFTSQVETTTRTPIPSFNNAPGSFSRQILPSSTPQVQVYSKPLDDPAFKELEPFVWEQNDSNNSKLMYPSRALAIFGLVNLQLTEVKSTCEAFGSLLYFRSEFFSTKGVLLIAYHDLRSARHAAGELESYLKQMIASNEPVSRSLSNQTVKVMYCTSLTSSSERDESALVISNLPFSVQDHDVSDLLTSTFGPLRSVQSEANGCYIVEFYDIQDASHALLEIQSTMPWGSSAVVTTKLRQDYERKRGQDLFALISKWRQNSTKQNVNGSMASSSLLGSNTSSMANGGIPSTISAHVHSNIGPSSPSLSQDAQTQSTASSNNSVTYHSTSQLVLGPDGQYSYIMVQQPHGYSACTNSQYGTYIPQPQIQRVHPIVTGPAGSFVGNSYEIQPNYERQAYWTQQPQYSMQNSHGTLYMSNSPNRTVISHPPMPDSRHQLGHSIPVYNPLVSAQHNIVDSSISSGNTSIDRRSDFPPRHEDNPDQLTLDIQAVKRGLDTRTSLMVRNIPNKYTQSMLLSEFEESGHGPGKIDFFYLPIDFRNKCNRGYAFVNFVDYRDILSFHETFNGKSWKIFKSEKICSITYARIQGKEGMMKRFQNSALMEKDQAYRPLVFAPSGEVIKESSDFAP